MTQRSPRRDGPAPRFLAKEGHLALVEKNNRDAACIRLRITCYGSSQRPSACDGFQPKVVELAFPPQSKPIQVAVEVRGRFCG